MQSICLTIPVFNPSEQDDPLILRQQAEARANWLALGRVARPALRQPAIPPSSRELPSKPPLPA